jgi:uncharacterized protein
MLIDVTQIPPEGLHIALPEAELDLGDSPGIWEGPAMVRATLHVGRSGRGLLIEGTYAGGVSLVCGRCLEHFPFATEDRFDLYCEVDLPGQGGDDRALRPEELDVTCLEGGRLDTDLLLRENLLLSLPVQPLCGTDCLGLCPQCGANLNQGPCGCGVTPTDPRLQALRKLL